jgi:hypothetical protein
MAGSSPARTAEVPRRVRSKPTNSQRDGAHNESTNSENDAITFSFAGFRRHGPQTPKTAGGLRDGFDKGSAETDFFTPIARNPLKSLDSEK